MCTGGLSACFVGMQQLLQQKSVQPSLPSSFTHKDILPKSIGQANDLYDDVSTVDTVSESQCSSKVHSDDEIIANISPNFISGYMLDALKVRRWHPVVFQQVKTLQLASQIRSRVELGRLRSGELGRLCSGKLVAVKQIPARSVDCKPAEFLRQFPRSSANPWFGVLVTAYLHEQSFPHVCEPEGVYGDHQHFYVASSFASEGDLFAWLQHGPQLGKQRETLMLPIVKQILDGARQLHDLGVAHRDLSLENIVVAGAGRSCKVKFIDFELSAFSQKAHGRCGKPSYIAPEMSTDTCYDAFLTDSFALGVVIFSLIGRMYPWRSTEPGTCKYFDFATKHGFRTLLKRRVVSRDDPRRLSEAFTEPLVDLLDGLLSFSPESRFMLGERCWSGAETSSHKSVWDLPWLQTPSTEQLMIEFEREFCST